MSPRCRLIRDPHASGGWSRRRVRAWIAGARGIPPRFRPRFEVVEDRTLLATLLVTSIGDSGPGSLRQAILDADASIHPSTINFAIPGPGVHIIAPSSPLPNIGASVLIDGASQPGYTGTPLIVLDGRLGGLSNGLTIVGSGATVRGLDVVGFGGAAIEIAGPDAARNQISSDNIGVDPTGTIPQPNGIAVQIALGAHDNTVGGTDPTLGNVIAYTEGSGVVVQGDDTVGNRIEGNRITSGGHDVRFDGTGGYVQLPSFPVGGAFTFEAWVESDDVHTSWSGLFDFGDAPAVDEFALGWFATNGTSSFGIQDANNNWTGVGSNQVFPEGQWVHIAASVNSQGYAAIYWNGTQVAASDGYTVAVPALLSRAHMVLGGSITPGVAPLVGAMHDVAIWSAARTPDQIRQDMAVSHAGSTDPALVAYYPFDEGEGQVVHDRGPHHYDGTLATLGGNLPSWEATNRPGGSPAIDLGGDGPTANEPAPGPGPGGAGVAFDGQGSHIQLPSFPFGGAFTFEAWVESNDVHSSWTDVFDFGDAPGVHEFGLGWFATNGWSSFGIQDPSGNWTGVNTGLTGAVFPEGQWVHLAVTLDDQGDAVIYWNGVVAAATQGWYAAVPPVLSRAEMVLGGSITPGVAPLDGAMHDVAIWSVARTPEQIQQDMASPPTGSEAGLAAYYPLDGLQGLIVVDKSPNHRDGVYVVSRQGPNDLQNHPVIVDTADGHLRGWLGAGVPGAAYRIEVFASAGYGPGGSGMAQTYLGSLQVTTDATGQTIFDIPFTVPAGQPIITATATDPLGNTSELSVRRPIALDAPKRSVLVNPGQPFVFSTGSGHAIVLHDPNVGPLDPAWDLALSVPQGTLTLSRTVGLSGTGSGTGTLHYRGALSALNAALDGLKFTPPPGFASKIALTLTAQSDGATPLTAVVTITSAILSVTTTADGGPGSLRQVILDANATDGSVTITFAIPGNGVHVIAPVAALPAITTSVLIDGFSQPGYAGTPLIQIRGGGAGSPAAIDGLMITSSGVTVRGLDIGGFLRGAGIRIDGDGASGNRIEANVIGADPLGTTPMPNGTGILIADGAHDNTVGGTDPGLCNLIGNSFGSGIVVLGDASVGNRLLGNRIFADGLGATEPDGAPYFDGSTYISLPDGLAYNVAASETIEAWFRTTAGGVILGVQDTQPNGGLGRSLPLLYVGTDGKLYGSFFTYDYAGINQVTSADVVDDGVWHQLALVVDIGTFTFRLYLDGRMQGSADAGSAQWYTGFFDQIGTGAIYDGTYNFQFPNAPSGWYGFQGQIAGVSVWNTARTADQVASDRFIAPSGTEPDLEAYYPLDEGQGATIHDQSANHRDGTLVTDGPTTPVWVAGTGGQAIDLGGDGPTANAPGPRPGPNQLQDAPIVVTAADGHIRGWLSGGLPNSSYHIEVFAGAGLDPAGTAQAQVFLSSVDVTTDGTGQAIFDTSLAAPTDGRIVSATATDAQGDTSELSPATRPASIETPTALIRFVPGQPTVFSVVAGAGIVLRDPEAGPLDAAWDLALSVPSGTFALSTLAGLVGTGDGTSTLHYRGGLVELNAALEGLRYNPAPGSPDQVILSLDAASNGVSAIHAEVILSDAIFQVTTTADDGPGSLRQAILDADNILPAGPSTIAFAIPGAGVQTIAPLSPLPPITTAILIDGTSQPGYGGTPIVVLIGNRQGGGDGLTITGSGATVRGLAVGGFASGAGIVIDGSGAAGNSIVADVIGADPSGTTPIPNGVGVRIADGAYDNVVGGADATLGNVIAFNGTGVVVLGDDSVGNRISNNRIFAPGVALTSAGTLRLDGFGHLDLPDDLIGSHSQAATIEARFQTRDGGVILGYEPTAFHSWTLSWVPALYVGTDGRLHGMWDGDGAIITSTQAVNDGLWHEAALTVDGAAGTLGLYLDGQLVGSVPVALSDFYASHNWVGTGYSDAWPDTPGGWFNFDGEIDDVKIWGMARTADQVQADMVSTATGSEPGLIADYPFDEEGGLTAHDGSGNHHDATIVSSSVAIDLGGDGLTPNAPAPGQGPNQLQNHPIVVSAVGGRPQGWLSGSIPNTAYRVEVFAGSGFGLDGSGQAQSFLGSIDVTTDDTGQVVFDIPFATPTGQPVLTATATDPRGNTSELSAIRPASVDGPAPFVRMSPAVPTVFSASAGDALVLHDPEAGPLIPSWDMTLSAPSGTFLLSTLDGLSGSGDGTGTLHYQGSLAALNAALEEMTFTAAADSPHRVVATLDARSAGAATLHVQVVLTDGDFEVTSADDAGPGSLRQAILDAENTMGSAPDTIIFAIPGAGVQIITPLSSLPPITTSILIDGFSQPRYAGTPLISLSGSLLGGDGLTIIGSGAIVRGLAISGFDTGIRIAGALASGNAIYATTIGAGAPGTALLPNVTAIMITDGAHDNTVGGISPDLANTIAFNARGGVVVTGDASVGNRILGNATFDNSQDTPTPDGKLHFDGTGGNVQLPSFTLGGALTLEAWVESDNVYTPNAQVFGLGDPYSSANLEVSWAGDTGRMQWLIGGGPNGPTEITSDAVFPQGRWVHVAATVDDQGYGSLYWDGQLVASGQLVVPWVLARTDQYIGGNSYAWGSGFLGAIDEVKLWSVARTLDQIRSDMMTVADGSEPGLEAYYSFDEGQGTTVHDATPNHRDATLGTTGSGLPSWAGRSSGQAIDLGDDGVTANASGPRQGPNNLQDYPVVITTADGRLRGWLGGGAPDARIHLEFFAGAGYTPDGSGEAEVYLGSLDVTTDGSGQAVFDVPFGPPADEPIVTATATDAAGNTSEVSAVRHTSIQAPAGYVLFAPGHSLTLSSAAGNAIALQDTDAGPLDPAWNLAVSVSAGTGALTLSTLAGLTGAGDGTALLHYRGGLAELNAALDELRFTPAAGFDGKLILDISAESPGAVPVQVQVTLTDGVHAVTTTADSGLGSLRQAILDAITTPGPSRILFAIPGTGIQTIRPASALPSLPADVAIDGTSQPDYAGSPLIELDGQDAGPVDGLTITVAGTTIRGLAIDGFRFGAGILISGPDATGNTIVANTIGTDATAAAPLSNGVGVRIADGAHDNTVGGTEPGLGNVISGDAGSGVVVTGDESVGNRILGNSIFENGRDTPTPDGKLEFDGSGGYVMLPGDPIGSFRQAETIEVWFETTSGGAILDRLGGSLSDGTIHVTDFGTGIYVGTDGDLYLEPGEPWLPTISSNTYVADGRWHNIALVVDQSSGTLGLYLDGRLVGSTSDAVSDLYYSSSTFNLIGTGYSLGTNSGSGWYNFAGQIDDVRIWSMVRSADEIRSDLTAAASGTEAGLEAYYTFDDAQGTTAHDATANHRDATLETMGGLLPLWVDRSGQPIDLGADLVLPAGHDVLRFDGTGGYVQLPSFPLGGAFTFEAWVESDDVHSSWTDLFDFGDAPGVHDFALGWYDTNGWSSFGIQDPSGNWTGVNTGLTGAVFPQGQWVHLAVTLDDQGDAVIYWNGVVAAATQGWYAAVPPVLSRAEMVLGGSINPGVAPFDGAMHDVAIWSVARTPEQIQHDMGISHAGSSDPALVAYYPMDEGQGQVVHDRGPHHYNGTLATLGGNLPTSEATSRPHNSPAIDLGGDGPTADAPSPRGGANQLQNYPIVVTTADGRLRGWLGGSLPNAAYHLEFFAGARPGEAEVYLGSLEVTTDDAGQVAFDVPYTPPADKPIVTATATDPDGNTSEISADRRTGLRAPLGYVLFPAATSLTFSTMAGDAIALDDPNAGPLDAAWDLTLSVSSGAGTLSLATTAGLIGDGNGTDSLHYHGGFGELNRALEGLRFTAGPDFPGKDTLTIVAQPAGQAAIQTQFLIGDGVYRVTTTADDGLGSLRQAILDANATPGTATIVFAVPGHGPQTINPATALPPITNAVRIDGTLQPGYSGTALIAIAGVAADGNDSMFVDGAEVTLRGMSIGPVALAPATSRGILEVEAVPVVAPGVSSAQAFDTYRIDTASDGRLIARAHPWGTTVRLELLDSQGQVLVLSDGVSATDPDGLIDVYLPPGRYTLAVQGTDGYDLSAELDAVNGLPATNQTTTGSSPLAPVVGDFNGDGHLDLATLNPGSHDISLLLGNGDGTFRPEQRLAILGSNPPTDLVVGDFNGDGRLDLVTNQTVLLGNGDGTFQARGVSISGNVFAAADFNGDGKLDLVCVGPSSLGFLQGRGDGTFFPERQIAVERPTDDVFSQAWDPTSYDPRGKLVVADLNNDGRLDLAIPTPSIEVSGFARSVQIVYGNGDGTFQPPVQIGLDFPALSLIATDFGDVQAPDGRIDLWGSYLHNPVQGFLTNGGGGHFGSAFVLLVGDTSAPFSGDTSVLAADFNGDGVLDLVDQTGVVLMHPGASVLQGEIRFPTRFATRAMVAGDFNGDGRIDIAGANTNSNSVTVFLGQGDGTTVTSSVLATAVQDSPISADWNGDGAADLLALDADGRILYRQGRPQEPGTFDPPVDLDPGAHSRGLTYVTHTRLGALVASVDRDADLVWLYAFRDGAFVRVGWLTTGHLPTQVVAADLTGDGWTDLIVRNGGDGSLSIFYNGAHSGSGTGNGLFHDPLVIPVGPGASDVATVATGADRRLDVVVANKSTGQVLVLHNRGDGSFDPPVPYRAGDGAAWLDTSQPGAPSAASDEETSGVAAASLSAVGPADLLTINPGNDTIAVLAGLGQGRFGNPTTIPTASPAQLVHIADLNHDGIPDLVILEEQEVRIELGDGKGGFAPPVAYDAGANPTGLTIADVNRDGAPDLLLGNTYGDVLMLLNQGDGTFRPYQKTDQAITLAVADLTGSGSRDVIYADQGLDRVVVDYGQGQSTVLGDRSTGLLAPGAVKLADLNGDGIADLIVANSGSNNVLVYPGLAGGQFGPALNGGHGFFTGTNPVQVTVADVNGDGRSDLIVANEGSNDVSILLNQLQDGAFTFSPGPRLKAGSGPVDTVVQDVNGDGKPDLLISNSQSNTVSILQGIGGGFFNDQQPQTFDVGSRPGPIFVGNFDGHPDLVTVNAGSNNLTLISGFTGSNPVMKTLASGGTDPISAFSFSTGNGFDNLVVANNGDGVLALFEGSAAGLTLFTTAGVPELPSPTALAFAGVTSDEVQFYGASEGREAAVLVTLSLAEEIASPSPITTPTSSPSSEAAALVVLSVVGETNLAGPSPSSSSEAALTPSLVPLQELSLSLVGTLLIVRFESNESLVDLGESESQDAGALAPSTLATVAVGQGLSGTGPDEDQDVTEDEVASMPAASSGDPSRPFELWQRLILGTEEALERFHRRHPELFPRPANESPKDGPGWRQGHVEPASGETPSEAIDRALESLIEDESAARDRDEPSRSGATDRSHSPSEKTSRRSTLASRDYGARPDYLAAMALATTVAGQFYFRSGERAARRQCPFSTVWGRRTLEPPSNQARGNRGAFRFHSTS